MSASLDSLPLGALYSRACAALGVAPQREIEQALSDGDPEAGLINLIVGTAARTRGREEGLWR